MKTTNEQLIQNLKDCGCSDKIINEFMMSVESGDKSRALSILAEHRQKLLDSFHKCDSCICCLDYLVNKIEKEAD